MKKAEMLAMEPDKKTKKERLMWRCIELIPEGGLYSSDQKLAVMMQYAVTGSFKRTAHITGIPRATIQLWSKTDWWAQAYALVQEIQQRKIHARLVGVMNKAVDKLELALDQGEQVIVRGKEGFTKAVKAVSARDLAYIVGVASDKQHKIREAERAAEKDDNAKPGSERFSNRLLNLAEQLANMAQAKAAKTVEGEATRVDENVQDAEIVNDDDRT